MTSMFPSPSRSFTAGEEYHPVSHHEEKHPPCCHLRTGVFTADSLVLGIPVIMNRKTRKKIFIPEAVCIIKSSSLQNCNFNQPSFFSHTFNGGC
jgi:hypothetical protein